MFENLIDADEATNQLAVVERALESTTEEARQEALAEGFLAWGPRFMHGLAYLKDLETKEGTGADRFQVLFDEASDLFARWLNGLQLTDRVEEPERRCLFLIKIVEDTPGLGRMLAAAMLELPAGHPLRDTDRARRLLEDHLEESRATGSPDDVVGTISDLLKYEVEPLDRSLELIDEGLKTNDEVEDEGLARDFRFQVAGYYSLRAIDAREDGDSEAQQDWISRALSVLEPDRHDEGPLSEDATRAVLVVAGAVAIGEKEPETAANLFRRVVDSPEAPRARAQIAAMHEGRLRVTFGDHRRAAEVLSEYVDSFEHSYLTAVTDDEIESTASDFADVVANLAHAQASLGEWDKAVQTLDRGKSLRFRHRAAMRETSSGRDLLALESVLYALSRGVPVEAGPAADAAADFLGAQISPQARMQEAYREARPDIAPELVQSPTVAEIAAALRPDEAAVIFGVHWRATMLAAIRPGDESVPSGRWLLDEWPTYQWLKLLGGPAEDGWLYALGAPEAGLDGAAALDQLLAAVDEALETTLAPFLEQTEFRSLVIVPQGWLHVIPFWATATLAPYDILMAPSAAQFVRARRQKAGVSGASAVVVSNPTGDLPVSEAEAELIASNLRRHGRTAIRLHGQDATEAAITSALAGGASIFHFSGHGQSDLFQATRSALLVHPGAESSDVEARVTALTAPVRDWHEEDEELRWAQVPGIGRVSERGEAGLPLTERLLDYSDRGTLWAQLDGDDVVRVAELWTAGDIMLENVLAGCELAVLSACESGSMQLGLSADEYAGLPAAVQLAGATTVVSTLWPIDDALTALHVDLLYDELVSAADEIDVPRAVRSVGQRLRSLHRPEAVELVEDLRQRTPDPIGRLFLERFRNDLEEGAEHPFERPYHWGTFYVTGRGRTPAIHADHV